MVEIPQVDIPSKFVSEVRMRICRNIRGYPFMPQMKKEDLNKVGNLLKSFQFNWPCFDLEGMEKEVLADLKLSCWMPDVTKISRLWPKNRYLILSHDNTVQIWINAEDHLNIVVTSKYGKLSPMLQTLKEIYTVYREKLKFYRNKKFGFLTVNPLNCGTAIKITFRIRLPNLMSEKEFLLKLCEKNNLSVRWKKNSLKREEIEADDWIEIENDGGGLGKSETQLSIDIATAVNELIKEEETRARNLIFAKKDALKKN